MPVMQLNSIEDTALWRRLKSGFSGQHSAVASLLAENTRSLCLEACSRMKAFPSLHPQYTLHDETHLLRVTELMSLIIPASVLETINPIEVALLILSAHLHDQGMVVDNDELQRLESSDAFGLFRNEWELDHPNLRDIRQRSREGHLSEPERARLRQLEHELEAAMLTEYVRRTHGDRSTSIIRTQYSSDPRLTVMGVSLAHLLARLCQSHVYPAKDITPAQGYRFDESVGTYQVNLPFIALVLRLADILDFDRDRTPDVLYRTIHFTSPVSIQEWEKHRSVEGWTVSSNLIRFTARCDHPVYEKAVREFIDWINDELADAQTVLRSFPRESSKYFLELPLKAEARIESKGDSYIYHDLEFNLSRDEVVKLFMTEELYHSPSLCIRELLQNSLDALRYRRALIKRDLEIDWYQGKVAFKHAVDEYGYEVVRCTDNGIGMDLSVVTRFLTRVGRSYYRSPEFEKERASLAAKGLDFDPCSRFGIGFLSCFMLGDRIVIHTRRDYGPTRGQGDPLVVEINGLGGMVVIRKGAPDQPVGTTVVITGRKKPTFFDEWEDKVLLTSVLRGYAIACEFPIEARCSIPEIEDAVSIPPTLPQRTTAFVKSGIRKCITFTQDFSVVEPLLGGRVTTSFLVNNDGHVVLSNDEAAWEPEKEHLPECRLATGGKVKMGYDRGQTCLDGILVCGTPGREKRPYRLGSWGNIIGLGRDEFILDVRGALKPPLTPARTPIEKARHGEPAWKRVSVLAHVAYGRLWAQLAELLGSSVDHQTFWQLAQIHRFNMSLLPEKTIWSKISIPVIKDGQLVNWCPVSQLGPVTLVSSGESLELAIANGLKVGPYSDLLKWEPKGYGDDIARELRMTVASVSVLDLEGGAVRLLPVPQHGDGSTFQDALRDRFSTLHLIPLRGDLSGTVAVSHPWQAGNRDHPLAAIALQGNYSDHPTDIEGFARSALWCLSNDATYRFFTEPGRPVDRMMRHLGHRYRTVDWTRYSPVLKPPYKVWVGHFVEITEDHLYEWSESIPKRSPDVDMDDED